jgi:peptide/nickel transport system substrate-binding protein/microcin C transport system substrate-binding protein
VIKTLLPHNNPVPMQAIVFNLRRAQFANLQVRQALTLAFDFEWMNKALFNGSYQRLQSFFYNSELAATGSPNSAEMAILKPLLPMIDPAMHPYILKPWLSPRTDGSGFNRANLLQARRLLLGAGYRYQGTQLVDGKGQPLKIQTLIANESLERVMLPWIKNLRKLGIDASIRVADKPQYIERVRQFDYDVIVDGFAQSLSPGNEQVGYWGSVSANQPGSSNSAGISSKAIDSLLTQLVTTKERNDVITLTHTLDRVLRAGFYMVPMYGLSGDRLAYWDYFAKPAVKPKYTIGVDYWWYDSRKASAMGKHSAPAPNSRE